MIKINKNIKIANTLPGHLYNSEDFLNKCKKKIFESTWQFLIDEKKIKEEEIIPIQYIENYIDEPLIITKKNGIKCMSNVCTHRGNILIEKKTNFKKKIICNYHGRQFDENGKMTFMPKCSELKNFPSQNDHLTKIPCTQWKQFIFNSLNPKYNLNEYFKDMETRVGWMPIEKFKYSKKMSCEYLVKANWALYCDNYLEGFHIPFVHEDLSKAIDMTQYKTEIFKLSNLQIGFSENPKECFKLPKNSPEYGLNVAAYYFWIFPNIMFNFYPWGLSINIVKPQKVDLTKIEYHTYIWDESKLNIGAGGDVGKVEKEDQEIIERVQKGTKSRYYKHGRYSPSMEQGTHHFHTLISDFLK